MYVTSVMKYFYFATIRLENSDKIFKSIAKVLTQTHQTAKFDPNLITTVQLMAVTDASNHDKQIVNTTHEKQ